MVDQKADSSCSPLMYTGLLPQEEMLEIGRRRKKLKIGLPKENHRYERRVGLTPEAVEVLVDNGHDVLVETGAGEGANYSDSYYSEHGGFIVDSTTQVWNADVIVKIAPLDEKDIEKLKGNQVVFSALHLSQQNAGYIKNLMQKKVSAIAFEYIKNQYGCFPILNSMNSISGNTSIMIASDLMSNNAGGKGVMLGGITGITPTEVVIIGAGTAAEFATRAALGLGAFVKVFDTSVQRLEELQRSIGIRLHTSIFHPQVLMRTLKSADVVIGAKSIFDAQPRFFVTEDMVKSMKKGSVIVDLNIDQGGSFETSEVRSIQEPTYVRHGVTHYCVPNVPSRVARTSSIALSNILSPILLNMGNAGGLKPLLKESNGLRNGVYLYNGILTNETIGNTFSLPYKDIDLLMAAF